MFMLIDKHINVKKCLLYCPSVLWLNELEDYEPLFERFDLLSIVYFIPMSLLNLKSSNISIPSIKQRLKQLLEDCKTFYMARGYKTTIYNQESKFNGMKGYFVTDVKHGIIRFDELVSKSADELFEMEHHFIHHLIHECPRDEDIQKLIEGYNSHNVDIAKLFNIETK